MLCSSPLQCQAGQQRPMGRGAWQAELDGSPSTSTNPHTDASAAPNSPKTKLKMAGPVPFIGEGIFGIRKMWVDSSRSMDSATYNPLPGFRNYMKHGRVWVCVCVRGGYPTLTDSIPAALPLKFCFPMSEHKGATIKPHAPRGSGPLSPMGGAQSQPACMINRVQVDGSTRMQVCAADDAAP